MIELLALIVCMGVYAIGAYTILKWTYHHCLSQYWRFTLRRHNGIPYPVIEAWDEEIQWRRERGFSD